MQTSESKTAADAADTTFGHISTKSPVDCAAPAQSDRINTPQIWRSGSAPVAAANGKPHVAADLRLAIAKLSTRTCSVLAPFVWNAKFKTRRSLARRQVERIGLVCPIAEQAFISLLLSGLRI
jgi:hypothetical protein